MSDNMRTNIAWFLTAGAGIGVMYVLDAFHAPNLAIGIGGAGTWLGLMLLAKYRKWIVI